VDVAEASSPECQSLATECCWQRSRVAARTAAVVVALLLGKPLVATALFYFLPYQMDAHQTASQTHAFGGSVLGQRYAFFFDFIEGTAHSAAQLMTFLLAACGLLVVCWENKQRKQA